MVTDTADDVITASTFLQGLFALLCLLECVLILCGIVCTAESNLAVKAMSDVSAGVLMCLRSSAFNLGVPNAQLELERWASG